MTVRVRLPDGSQREVPSGTPFGRILSGIHGDGDEPWVAARVNNEILGWDRHALVNCSLEPVGLSSRAGMTIYRKSLCFLVSIASRELFPDRRLVIGHALGQGYFYRFEGTEQVAQEDLSALESRMRALVAADEPIVNDLLSYEEAVELFRGQGQADTALLLSNQSQPQVLMNRCDGFRDLSHGPLVPSTGVLSVFSIMAYPPGFLLRYPPSETPRTMGPFVENPILFSIYKEYKNWGKILGVHSVGTLNELNLAGRSQEFIHVAEALHDKKIAEIADRIVAQRDSVHVVLIAGPSSSGKTTFAKKLSVQLRVVGRNPIPISLDDYYKNREDTPRDEDGNYDFEALEALDVELLNENLLGLLRGGEVRIPVFDFASGARKPEGRPLTLPERSILILEGIHGLNDLLTPLIPRRAKYRIYVSALTQLNLDDHTRVSTTDNRLIRRIVRDSQFRGHQAIRTLSMWPSVRRGEDRNIFPFQNSADSAFNSALDYELAVLKVYAEPLLATVKPDVPEYEDARALLAFLGNFAPLPTRWVPPTSILREFIGESAFKY